MLRRGALSSFFEKEIARHHGVNSRGVEAADRVARRADQRLAEQVERRVVENRQAGLFAEGVQQAPVERVVVLRDGVDANGIARKNRTAELVLIFRTDASYGREMTRVRAGFEVLRSDLQRNRSREFGRRFAVL